MMPTFAADKPIMNEQTGKGKDLMKRREAVVPRGVGVFVNSTARQARGAVIMDEDGRELLDFGGGLGVLNAGHCPEPVVRAIQAQAENLIHSCFHVSTYERYIELCEKLAALLPHGGPTKVMLTNTGAESVENAVKIARQATGRDGILCYTGAFHGRTMMAMSLTSKIDYKLNCGPFAPEIYRLHFPNYFRYGQGLTEADFVNRELKNLWEAARNVFDPNRLAAVVIELVQGEGGFNVAPRAYIEGLREFCDKHGIMLIFDEVQTGFCRTGKWGAYQHYDVIPDISTWAKSLGSGMPIGAVIGKAGIMDKAVPGTIGGTFQGNPVSCAASLATLQFMENEGLNNRALSIGDTIDWKFRDLKRSCPAIGDIRGIGAMQAIELVESGDPRQPDAALCASLAAACLEKGLILLSAGTHKNIIRILCPLVISDQQLNRGLDIMENELMRLWDERVNGSQAN